MKQFVKMNYEIIDKIIEKKDKILWYLKIFY